MKTTTTTLPQCDCLNDCGDDPGVRARISQACDRLLKQYAIDKEEKRLAPIRAAAPGLLAALQKIARYDDDMNSKAKADISRAALVRAGIPQMYP